MENFTVLKTDFAAILTCMLLASYCSIGSSSLDGKNYIAIHPSNATVTRGTNVTLTCELSEPSRTCKWFIDRDEATVGPDSMYNTYLDDDANQRMTKNCSIQIALFHWADAGFWQCSSGSGPASERAYLTMKAANFDVQPRNATVKEGSSTILECLSNAIWPHEICSWLHNGNVVDANNYIGRFLFPYDVRPRTGNCSMIIHGFTRADAGDWQCVITASDSLNKVTSTKAYLTFLAESTVAQQSKITSKEVIDTSPKITQITVVKPVEVTTTEAKESTDTVLQPDTHQHSNFVSTHGTTRNIWIFSILGVVTGILTVTAVTVYCKKARANRYRRDSTAKFGTT